VPPAAIRRVRDFTRARQDLVAELVRPGKSGGCYVCEPPLSLPDASAL